MVSRGQLFVAKHQRETTVLHVNHSMIYASDSPPRVVKPLPVVDVPS